jgi:hypothetical protein
MAHPSGCLERIPQVLKRSSIRRAFVPLAVFLAVGAAATSIALSQTGGEATGQSATGQSSATSGAEPAPLDMKQFLSQPRVPVMDERGVVRGTIPTDVYIHGGGSADAGNAVVPVLDDAGHTTGYWVANWGFTETSVATAPGFDPAAYAAKKNYDAYSALSPEAKAGLQQRGVTPPPAS